MSIFKETSRRITPAQQAAMYYARKRHRAARAAAAPDSLSNIVAWFRYDTAVTLDISGNVVSWGDVSGNYLLTHPQGDALPTVNVNGIHFAGGNSGGNAGGLQGAITLGADTTKLATFAIAAQDDNALGDGRLVTYIGDGFSVDYDNMDSAALLMSIAPNPTDHDGLWSIRNLIEGAATAAGTWPNNTFHRVATLQSPTGSESYIDNVLLASDAAESFGNFGTTGTLCIGSMGLVPTADLNHCTFSGTVREVIILKGDITAEQRDLVDAYLATRMP